MSPSDTTEPGRIDRRAAIKWMLTAAASTAFLDTTALAAAANNQGGGNDAVGYGTDPDLMKNYKAGDLWPLTFNKAQRVTTIALCDLIIPADEKGPRASSVGVQDFVDEWISAPYAGHSRDRTIILEGLAWIEAESQRRFGTDFTSASGAQQAAICDDICDRESARPEFSKATQFFARFRFLTASGYYTTQEGMKDIGYTGNVPQVSYEGPPKEVLQILGLA